MPAMPLLLEVVDDVAEAAGPRELAEVQDGGGEEADELPHALDFQAELAVRLHGGAHREHSRRQDRCREGLDEVEGAGNGAPRNRRRGVVEREREATDVADVSG